MAGNFQSSQPDTIRRLTEIANSKVKVRGFHFDPLQLVLMNGRAFTLRSLTPNEELRGCALLRSPACV